MNTRPGSSIRPPNSTMVLLQGRAAVDAGGVLAENAGVLVELTGAPGAGRCHLLAAGPAADVRRHPLARDARVIDRPDCVLIPGLINAHTHLDLTQIGPIEHDPAGGFLPWVQQVRTRRATTVEGVGASVRRGVELSRAGGVVAVGDIAGAVRGQPTPWAAQALADAGMSGVSFLEFFGIGAHEDRALAALRAIAMPIARSSAEGDPVRLGLQPHAPYSVGLGLFQEVAAYAKAMGVRLSTHLAETAEEREFIESGSGPFADLLREVGAWDDSLGAAMSNPGVSPVRWIEPALHQARFAAAHLNDVDDADIAVLARTRTSVVYCPRASAYFGAPERFSPHRYRDMIAAGVNVALGTDSILNLPARSASTEHGGMSTLDEMRLLYRRDGTEARVLLAMGTVNAARALGLHPPSFLLSGPLGGPIGGVSAVRAGEEEGGPLEAVMRSDAPPELLVSGLV